MMGKSKCWGVASVRNKLDLVAGSFLKLPFRLKVKGEKKAPWEAMQRVN